jgi:hypothetical protein
MVTTGASGIMQCDVVCTDINLSLRYKPIFFFCRLKQKPEAGMLRHSLCESEMGNLGEQRVDFWAWMAIVIKAFQFEQEAYVTQYAEQHKEQKKAGKPTPEVDLILNFSLTRETRSPSNGFERESRQWRYMVPNRGGTMHSQSVSDLLHHHLVMPAKEGKSTCYLTLTVELNQLDTPGNSVVNHPLFRELNRCNKGDWERQRGHSVGANNQPGRYVIHYDNVPCEG